MHRDRIRSGRAFAGSKVIKLLTAGACAALAAVPLTANAQATSVPRVHPSSLSPTRIAQLAARPDRRVIVILKNQENGVTGRDGTLRVRAARLAADQKSILAELHLLKAPEVHGYSLINAVSATVSAAEASRLAANPLVGAVIPDTQIAGPALATSVASDAAAVGGHVVAAANVRSTVPAAGGTQICPSNPADPLIEPEALSLMHVVDEPGSTAPVARSLADGSGTKVAVFPDGLDPNIPDFMRGGTSAIFDYQDFTGEGTGGVTGGEEAFGDASSIISQGNQVFDLSGEVNPAHPLPPGCNIRIEGVAPGASVAVMKVFGDANLAFNSLILQAIEYAVDVDHVDILSQSFGGNPIPNPGTDADALIDAEAVAAGVTVIASSGDAGITNTIGTPATNPGVISAGATTSYQLYAQTTSYGYQFGGNGWLSNEVSSFSSTGDTEYGPDTIDVVAPGESGWADCSTDTATFTECADQYNGADPQPIVAFGGTSQSCPLTAGTAALVIEAYRITHGGASPTPALVKQILMSSAQDLDAPGQNQGAGFVDALRAVEMAESIKDANGTPAPQGDGLLISPNSISATAVAGTSRTVRVSVTNTGAATATIAPKLRALGTISTIASGSLSLDPTTDPTFVYQTGAVLPDVHVVPFTVPAGTDRMVASFAWDTASQPSSTLRLSLFSPTGQMTSQSRPQGAAGGFGQVEVHDAVPGTWTMLVFSSGAPYTGAVTYTITKQSFHNVSGAVTPLARTIAPDQTRTFLVTVRTPLAAGDLNELVVFADSIPDANPQSTIPVALRALVPFHGNVGSFHGTITGGNERAAFYGQELVYQFNMPAGERDVDVDVTVSAPGYQVLGFLVDPRIMPVDIESTETQGQSALTTTMHFSWANPTRGRWSLDLAQVNGVSSLLTSARISGKIRFNTVRVHASGVPNSAAVHLANGVPVAATISITNTGNSEEDFSLDPRNNSSSALSLASLTDTTGTLPISDFSLIPQFVVPPFTSQLEFAAESTVPINFDASPAFGFPDNISLSSGDDAVEDLSAPDIPASVWGFGPTEIGPFAGVAPTVPWSAGGVAATKTFDLTVDTASGDIWSALEGLTGSYNPILLDPGQSGSIAVTFTPSGTHGQVVVRIHRRRDLQLQHRQLRSAGPDPLQVHDLLAGREGESRAPHRVARGLLASSRVGGCP